MPVTVSSGRRQRHAVPLKHRVGSHGLRTPHRPVPVKAPVLPPPVPPSLLALAFVPPPCPVETLVASAVWDPRELEVLRREYGPTPGPSRLHHPTWNECKLFYINLAVRTDRNVKMLVELSRQHIPLKSSVIRVEAVHGTQVDVGALERTGFLKPNCNLRKGELGCYLSHVAVWQECVRRGSTLRFAVVLEDDTVCLTPHFMDDVLSALHELEASGAEWDVLYLSRNIWMDAPVAHEGQALGPHLYVPVHSGTGTHSYVINPQGALRLLEMAQNVTQPVDLDFRRMRCVSVREFLTRACNWADSDTASIK